MTDANDASAERAPLLSGTTPSTPDEQRNGKDEAPTTFSALRSTIVVFSMGLLIFLQATNISIITTTQSAIAADLDAFEKVSWLTSAYLIAMSSAAPLYGRLSQLFSPRLCVLFSTVLLCIGSIIIAVSSSFEIFVLGRVVSGAGCAGTLVVATIIAIQMAGPKRRGLFIGIINSGLTVGVSLGAVIAGAVAPKFGWKVLFGGQAPLSLLAGFGLVVGIPAKHIPPSAEYAGLSTWQKLARIDYFGALSLTMTIVLFLLGFAGPRILVTPIVLSLILLPLFILNEVRIAADPIIPISVLKSRGTLMTCLATFGFMVARWSVLFFTPVYALAIRGWSPAVAGSILIPTNAGFATGGLLAGFLHIRRAGSFYIPCLVTMGLFPTTMLILAFISNTQTPAAAYIVVVFCNGLCVGAALNYTLVHALHLTIPAVHPIVLSLIATFRGFSGSFGSAIGGGYFTRVLSRTLRSGFDDAGLRHREKLLRRLVGSPALVRGLEGKEKEVAVNAYETAIQALFLAGMGLGIIFVLIQAGTGWKEPAEIKEQRQEGEEEEVGGEESLVAGT